MQLRFIDDQDFYQSIYKFYKTERKIIDLLFENFIIKNLKQPNKNIFQVKKNKIVFFVHIENMQCLIRPLFQILKLW